MSNKNTPATTRTLADIENAVREGQGQTVDDSDGYQAWDAPGDSVAGIYAGRESIEIQGTPTYNYSLIPLEGDPWFGMFDEQGEQVTRQFHGTQKLDKLMANLEEGMTVHIVYSKDIRTQAGFDMKDFIVTIL